MKAIKDLKILLKSMKPRVVKGKFVFCTVSDNLLKKLNIKPVLIFKEDEGLTLIIEKETADKNYLAYEGIWAMITLSVNSSLSAVGFLAEITKKLAENKISVNAVSAYYHDHLFVPYEKAKKALCLLKELSI